LINVENQSSDPAFTETWFFQCIDTNEDGTQKIQIGPEAGDTIDPAITFTWNPTSQTFESPSGMIGAHFVVTTGKDNTRGGWGEVLEELKNAGKLRYPFDQ
jgi:hypothetical protein|tara:strand:+ start:53 stop:355 length:303 start_codon:yes stop_codon:yes gene_type:complete